MLKANTKPKVVKPKTKHHKVIPSYTQHHKTKKMGFFPNFSHATAMAQNSAPPRPLYSSGGGIPYTSTFESYGITNKPPYFLQSLIAKTTQSDYEIPVKPESSSTKTGMNPMNGNEGKRKQFPEQGKTEAVQYVDLVAPAKSQNIDNQPDYIALQPSKQPIKEKLMERAEYRKNNEIPSDVKVSSIMKKEKMNEKRKEVVKEKKRLRGKTNEEL